MQIRKGIKHIGGAIPLNTERNPKWASLADLSVASLCLTVPLGRPLLVFPSFFAAVSSGGRMPRVSGSAIARNKVSTSKRIRVMKAGVA